MLTRLTNVDRGSNVLGQFAYELNTLPEEPAGFGTSGITEILAISERRLLVIERATVENSEGIFNNVIELYGVESPVRQMSRVPTRWPTRT